MKKALFAAAILTLFGVIVIIFGARWANLKATEPLPPTTTANELSLSEIKKSNTAQNCWIVYGGRVFDISRKTSQADSQIAVAVCGTIVDALPTTLSKDALSEYQIGILSL
jgi:hypothetical protein